MNSILGFIIRPFKKQALVGEGTIKPPQHLPPTCTAYYNCKSGQSEVTTKLVSTTISRGPAFTFGLKFLKGYLPLATTPQLSNNHSDPIPRPHYSWIFNKERVKADFEKCACGEILVKP